MKKSVNITKIFFSLFLAIVMAMSVLSIFSAMPLNANAATAYPTYSDEVYNENIVRPYWKSNVIFNEVAVPIGRWDSSSEYGYATGCALLQYKPIKVLSVKDHTLKTTYTEGIDYVVDSANHSLTFPSGSRIKAIDSRAARSTGTNQFVDQINTSFGSNYSYHASNPVDKFVRGGYNIKRYIWL